jgi:hypothetical protein
MGTNILLLKPGHGKKSTLDKAYNKHLINILNSLDEDSQARWETYSFIIEKLIEEGKEIYLKEIKYRLTDGENPNEVILDILERETENMDGLTWMLKRRIEEFLEDDFFKRFYY